MRRRSEIKKTEGIKKANYSACSLGLGEMEINLKVIIMSVNRNSAVLRTYYPLEPGDLLNFNNGIGSRKAVVRMSVKGEDKIYSVAVNFYNNNAVKCRL